MATLKNTTISSTSHISLPIGTTAQRPATPTLGQIRYNSTTQYLEVYDGSGWKNLSKQVTGVTGGPTNTTGLLVWLDGNYQASTSSWSNKVSGGVTYSPTGSFTYGTEGGNGYFTNNGGANGWYWNTDAAVADNFTWEVWCKPSGGINLHGLNTFTTSHSHLVSADNRGSSDCGAGFSVGTNGVSGNEHANSYLSVSAQVSYSISSSVPSLITFVYTSKTPSVYVNGVNAGGNVRTSGRSRVMAAGARVGYGDYGSYNGNYYVFRYYNRSLDSTEIAANFAAERSRFGV